MNELESIQEQEKKIGRTKWFTRDTNLCMILQSLNEYKASKNGIIMIDMVSDEQK